MLRICCLLVLSGLMLAAPVAAQTVEGRARVIDGDTIEIAGERIRLYGIDAPEMSQPCTRDGRAWDCGRWATREVAARLRGQRLRCEGRGRDDYGRLLAVCYLPGGADLNALLVREGVAFAFRRYASDYRDAEKEALFAQAGLWAGEVEVPSEFRAAQRATANAVAAEVEVAARATGCVIKGNISQRGERIFHVPGQRDYQATRINERAGERWFCSAEEARAAGWRAAQR